MRKEGWQALGLMAPILSLMRQGHEALTRSGGGSGMVSVEQYKHDIDGWKKTAASWEKNTNEALDLIKKWKADYKELQGHYVELTEHYKELQEKYFATLEKLEALEKKNSYRMFDDWGTRLGNELADSMYKSQINRLQKEVERLKQALEESKQSLEASKQSLEAAQRQSLDRLILLASYLALNSALEAHMLRVDPNHPLLADEKVRHELIEAGKAAVMALKQSADLSEEDVLAMAREVGLTYAVPERGNASDVLSHRALSVAYLKRIEERLGSDPDLASAVSPHAHSTLRHVLATVHDMAQGREAKEALQDLLRHIDPESPLLTERVAQKARALSMEAFQKQQQQRRQQRVALQEASLMAPMKDFAAQAAEQLASEADAKPQA